MTPKTISVAGISIMLLHALPAAACDNRDLTPSKPAQLCSVMQDTGQASHFMLLRLCRLDQQQRETASDQQPS